MTSVLDDLKDQTQALLLELLDRLPDLTAENITTATGVVVLLLTIWSAWFTSRHWRVTQAQRDGDLEASWRQQERAALDAAEGGVRDRIRDVYAALCEVPHPDAYFGELRPWVASPAEVATYLRDLAPVARRLRRFVDDGFLPTGHRLPPGDFTVAVAELRRYLQQLTLLIENTCEKLPRDLDPASQPEFLRRMHRRVTGPYAFVAQLMNGQTSPATGGLAEAQAYLCYDTLRTQASSR